MKYVVALFIILVLFCIGSFVAGAKWLKVRHYMVRSPKIKPTERAIRITLISDIHEKTFGKNNCKLINKIEETIPDVIVIAGDIADTYGKVGGSYEPLFKALPKIAPTYMVLGNHDYSARRDIELSGVAANTGVHLLDDASDEINIDGNIINIIGLSDYYRENIICQTLAERLDIVPVSDFMKRYNVLISHRPEELEEISKRGIDLMLCGHTHGGQVRLPFVGGVFSPCSMQLFPKYDMGLFSIGDMDLIISSGLGASVVPLRFCNRPEIVTIDIYPEE